MVERKAADERARREALRLEQRRGRRLGGGEAIARVVADAVLVRIAARENRRVRHERHDRVRVREVEARAVRGQLVQVRRGHASAARAERIAAPRVDRHEQHIAVGIDVERERRRAQPPPRAEPEHDCARQRGPARSSSVRAWGAEAPGAPAARFGSWPSAVLYPHQCTPSPVRRGCCRSPLAACAVTLAAQQPSQRQPTFRTTTDLVEVDVVAVDQDGQPVHGLTQADFTLFDRRKPQTIATFQEVTHEHEVDPAPLDAPAAAPPPRRDVASNRTAESDRLVVIVVDDLHIYKGRTDTARQITRAIVRDLGSQASMGILFTSGDHNIEVTEDRTALLAAIDRDVGPAGISAADSCRGRHARTGTGAHAGHQGVLRRHERVQDAAGRRAHARRRRSAAQGVRARVGGHREGSERHLRRDVAARRRAAGRRRVRGGRHHRDHQTRADRIPRVRARRHDGRDAAVERHDLCDRSARLRLGPGSREGVPPGGRLPRRPVPGRHRCPIGTAGCGRRSTGWR